MTTVTGMGQLAARYWWVLLVRGVLLIILGILMLVWPISALWVFAILFVAYLFIDGVMSIVQGFSDRKAGRPAGWEFTQGALSILLGAVILIWPKESGVVFVFIIAIWAIIAAVLGIVASVGLRKVPGSGWGWILAWSILAGLFGIALMINPAAGILSLLWLVAIWAIVAGVMMILFSFLVRRVGQSATVVDAGTV
jgi:uncharacterized membrane protein HdeD (DUF308 family)